MATDGTPLCPDGKEKTATRNDTRDELIPLHVRLVITDDIYVRHGEGGVTMIAAVLLIVLMVVAVTTTELCMRCSADGKESVESPAEIVGD
ncbi:hypothetical protein GCM10009850_067150 [Nonomuraea monospora]|uniref:Uncharacterized protein n=1 Tax=Nonomuraea monospora TaxID=568818 RepID=A0ABN3CPN7_9ACTN